VFSASKTETEDNLLNENIKRFLVAQKAEMKRLDEAEGLSAREERGFDFSLVDKETGVRKGGREILYDNTINWLLSEQNGILFKESLALGQKGVLNESTLSTAISTFTTSLLPAVRRIYSRLLAMELISVQPLAGPSGYIYYLDHLYGTTGGGATAGQRLDEYSNSGYADSTEAGTIREINFQLKSKLVETEIKKLKAVWTLESSQDLSSQWKLDLWSELQPQLIDEIIREIDAKILAALLAGAGAGNTNWNANGYLGDDKSTIERRAYRETLYEAIEESAGKVFKKKFVRPNWLVMDGDTFTRLTKLERWSADPSTTPDQQSMIGWRYEGTLAGKYKVYVDPWFTANKILMGFRGADWKYAVGFYSPYVPVFLSEEYIVNDDFSQRARGAMSRYAYGIIPEAHTGSTVNNGLATVTITSS
jgi:hypothetical protein